MKRIILYRYYHKFETNKELLKFFKFLNPDIDIYGLYGGPEEHFDQASIYFKGLLSDNFLIKGKTSEWKWRNDDISFQIWFNDFGHTVQFDYVHVIEWDLLYFQPIEKLFSHVPVDSLAITGLIPLEKVIDKWHWTAHSGERDQWLQLMDYFKLKYNYNQQPYGMVGTGVSFPRSFLEKIQKVEIPEISLGELRVPMLAQVLGFDMVDTKFYKGWFSRHDIKFFNCVNYFVSNKNIRKQLKRQNGYRAFHPFRDEISFEDLKELYQLTTINRRSLLDILFNRN
jgi:hypothetical protein